MYKLAAFMSMFLFTNVSTVWLQDSDPLPPAERVEVTAQDGLSLVGDFYAAPDASDATPSVLLLHGQSSDRHSWETFIGALLQNGFNVLTVDQRAHGETGGDRDLIIMSADVQVWLNWLRTLPTVDDHNIAVIGSSMGTVPALAGCAADTACRTVIAISPGDFPTLDEAMFQALSDRSVLFIVGRSDNVLYDTKKLFDRTSGEAVLYVYQTATHGNGFFSPRSNFKTRATTLIINWLKEHRQAVETP